MTADRTLFIAWFDPKRRALVSTRAPYSRLLAESSGKRGDRPAAPGGG
jgi:hypothetical protein